MKVLVAASAGYCFGVRRAVDTALEYAPAYTLGPLIHNTQAVGELSERGVQAVESIDEVPEGARAVIRSHGVSKAVQEALESAHEVIDATCPFVAAIHRMVSEAAEAGIPVIVCGQKEHPEVIGTVGWAGKDVRVVASPEEAAAAEPVKKALIVAQTTLGSQLYSAICEELKKRVAEPDIRNTVCSATRSRQEEAETLAKQADVMLVVGDKLSANTRRLSEIARQYCKRTYLIDGARSLEYISLLPRDIVGITAGASTPCGIIEEVVAHMNDIENKVNSVDATTAAENDFASQIDQTMVQIRPGQTVTGTVLYITDDEVFVSIGYKSDGLIKKSDLCDTDVKVGDELEVEVVKVNDGEGNVILSQKNIINRKVWDEIVAKSENNEYIEAVAKEAVKGGLICEISGIRTFVPASQLANRYVDKIDQFIGQNMKLKIIELDRAKKRIVASRKAVIAEEAAARKQEIWGKLAEGSIVKGTVRRLTDFGAFVDVGGVDGLVHVTNLSWGHVNNPAEVVNIGDEIDVKILSLDMDKERISLSRKATLPKPWTTAEEKYPVGAVVEGKVVRLTAFGAFVTLEDGLDGLVHISQCAPNRIEKVEDALKVGDIVNVKVLSVDTEKKRISLSIKQALEDAALSDDIDQADITDEYVIDEEPASSEENA